MLMDARGAAARTGRAAQGDCPRGGCPAAQSGQGTGGRRRARPRQSQVGGTKKPAGHEGRFRRPIRRTESAARAARGPVGRKCQPTTQPAARDCLSRLERCSQACARGRPETCQGQGGPGTTSLGLRDRDSALRPLRQSRPCRRSQPLLQNRPCRRTPLQLQSLWCRQSLPQRQSPPRRKRKPRTSRPPNKRRKSRRR